MRSLGDLQSLGSACLRGANRAVSPIDRLARKNGEKSAPVFIVGLPRSGTSLVYELIVQRFDVSYLSRIYSYTYGLPNLTTRLTLPFTRSPSAHYKSTYGRIPGFFSPAENHVLWDRWFRASQELGHHIPAGSFDEEEIRAARLMLGSMEAIAGRPFVFKNVYFTMSLQVLLEMFPEAHIVVVQRDLASIGASIIKALKSVRGKDWWSIKPPFFKDVLVEDDLTRAAFLCVRATQMLRNQIQSIPGDKYLLVDYADVCEAPHTFLQRMHEWLGKDFQLRRNADIPLAFEMRKPQGFFTESASRFDQLCDAMFGNGDEYLQRVGECVQKNI